MLPWTNSSLEESDRPPFATRLERLLAARYGDVSGPVGDYMLAPDRLEEAQAVEEYARAFRLAETLDNGPTVGIGRINPAGPPRLRECLKAGRRHNWGLEHMLIAAELNDLLLAHGYDLGISAEAEGAAALLAGEFERVMAWETIVALCQAPTDELYPESRCAAVGDRQDARRDRGVDSPIGASWTPRRGS